MVRVFLIFVFILISLIGQSQKIFTNFLYGQMVKGRDTLKGYFRFSPQITQEGQTVFYRETWRSDDVEKFQSWKYEYFEADSVYLESFGVISTITGDINVMIPRIIDGKIQLFEAEVQGNGAFGFGTTESFYIKKGTTKLHIKKSKFKKQMRTIVGDDEFLMQKIENDELKFEDLADIVRVYNVGPFPGKTGP